MTAKQWLTAHPDAAQWAQQVYAAHPGRQKHGVWDTIWAGLKARGYDGGMNAIRLCLTKPTHLTPLTPPPIAPEIAPPTPSLHVKKLHVHVPHAIDPSPTGLITAVLWSDTHLPFQDDEVVRCVMQVVRVARPNILIHGGDLLDCYRLSRFDQNPKRLHRLQDEVDAARQHLGMFRALAPQARFVFLEGNHEDRLRRTLWNLPSQAQALMQLDAITTNLTWPKLLGLDDLDIEFYAYGEQSRANILPKWITKHGSVVRKVSGYTARAEHEKYGKSGSSGHTHRLGFNMYRDHNGAHGWTETGCTCQLTPEYAEDPDWHQGCVVLTFEPTTGAFQCEPVFVLNGRMTFRGAFYDARDNG